MDYQSLSAWSTTNKYVSPNGQGVKCLIAFVNASGRDVFFFHFSEGSVFLVLIIMEIEKRAEVLRAKSRNRKKILLSSDSGAEATGGPRYYGLLRRAADVVAGPRPRERAVSRTSVALAPKPPLYLTTVTYRQKMQKRSHQRIHARRVCAINERSSMEIINH